MDSTGEPTKRCSLCGERLPLSLFMPRSDRPGQFHAGCRPCRNARQNARYRSHPLPPLPEEKRCGGCERVLPVSSFPARSDGTRGVRSRCYQCRRREKRRYDDAHRTERKEYQRSYYRANAEACKRRIRRSNAAKPEKYRAIHASWKRANKGAVNASTHKRRARIAGNGGTWTEEEWQRLKARYDWRCLMCGLQEMTDGVTLCFDHVIPVSLGGLNIISNGQPLCRRCNSRKHRKMLDLRPDFPL